MCIYTCTHTCTYTHSYSVSTSFFLPCFYLILSYVSHLCGTWVLPQKEAYVLLPDSTLSPLQTPAPPQSHSVCQRVLAADPGPAAQYWGVPLHRPRDKGPSRHPGGHTSPGRWVPGSGMPRWRLPSTLLACRNIGSCLHSEQLRGQREDEDAGVGRGHAEACMGGSVLEGAKACCGQTSSTQRPTVIRLFSPCSPLCRD